MKRNYLITLFVLIALTVGAENRKWDFTNWSTATLANLEADAKANGQTGPRWSDMEKADKTTDNDGKAYWWNSSGQTELKAMAGGSEVVIQETAGLLFNHERARALAIVHNLSGFHGSKFLWMGSKTQSFIIPDVLPGSKITIHVESHKASEGRGVSLSVNGNKVAIREGSETPKEYTKCVWTIPADAGDGPVDVKVTNSNGCHIYDIDVNESAPSVENGQVAFVYDSNFTGYSLDADPMYSILCTTDRFFNVDVVPVDVASPTISEVDKDSLMKFNVVVVSGAIASGNPYAATLKEAIAYVPMVGLNANLYADWGYGEKVMTAVEATVPEKVQGHFIFKPSSQTDLPYDEGGKVSFYEEGEMAAVKLADGYFSKDLKLAMVDDNVAVHIHNSDRNAYIYLPYTVENQAFLESVADILINAVTFVNNTKTEIPVTKTPTFNKSYNNLTTLVELASETKGAKFFYTLDGTTPTLQSTPYEGPITVTANDTHVYAVAIADGYNLSEVGRDTVDVFETTQVPTISYVPEQGRSVVTIEAGEPGLDVYYNFTGTRKVEESSIYSEPLVLTHHATVTAFTAGTDTKKPSASVSLVVAVKGETIMKDVISHFDADRDSWSGGESKTKYYTEGKKNGYNYYLTEEKQTVTPEGNDTTIIEILGPANVLTVWNPGKGWEAKSYGQGMLWERITVSSDIDDFNGDARYRGVSAYDQGASDNCVTFGNIRKSDGANNDPYSCSIQSTEAFQGPFDIIAYVGNASGSNRPAADIWLSTDTLSEDNWVKLDTLEFSDAGMTRYLRKNHLSYTGTDKVFVKLQAQFSSIQVYDIMILNHGEESEAYQPVIDEAFNNLTTGIDNVNAGSQKKVVRTMVYSINGMQLNAPEKGINIIRQVYEDGTVKSVKMVVR